MHGSSSQSEEQGGLRPPEDKQQLIRTATEVEKLSIDVYPCNTKSKNTPRPIFNLEGIDGNIGERTLTRKTGGATLDADAWCLPLDLSKNREDNNSKLPKIVRFTRRIAVYIRECAEVGESPLI